MAIACFYFVAISRNWFWLYFTMTALGSISFVLTMAIVPESPKWLLIHGKREEAIKALNWIGRINGTKTPISESATFVESDIIPTTFDQTRDANELSRVSEEESGVVDQSSGYKSHRTQKSYYQSLSSLSKQAFDGNLVHIKSSVLSSSDKFNST